MYNDTALCDYSFVGGACPHNQRENMMNKYLRKGIRKISAGSYSFHHNSGRCGIDLIANGKWVVAEECTGQVQATLRTKKAAIDYIIGTFGCDEEAA